MTKLEEKLIELGYVKKQTLYLEDDTIPYIEFKKGYCYHVTICIELYDNKVDTYGIYEDYDFFTKQQAIDNLQKAFNIMQKDLAILKELENE